MPVGAALAEEPRTSRSRITSCPVRLGVTLGHALDGSGPGAAEPGPTSRNHTIDQSTRTGSCGVSVHSGDEDAAGRLALLYACLAAITVAWR